MKRQTAIGAVRGQLQKFSERKPKLREGRVEKTVQD
jgi:hypothetical protein